MTQDGTPRQMIVTVDGPAGAGKSTVARLVAEQLGYLYLDTGAMYRALTLKALQAEIDLINEQELGRLAQATALTLERGLAGNRVFLDGVEVTEAIRDPLVSQHVSQVAAVPAVRRRLVEMQRQLAAAGGVVVDGRDIGSYVLPWAERKFFVTASLQERARRRQQQLAAAGHQVPQAELEAEIDRRDRLDAGRAMGPLVQPKDAVVVDTTGRSVESVVQFIVSHCQEG